MRLALYQPDIPQNCGTLLRLGACLGVPVDIIEPCGFLLDDKRLRRAGMDYLQAADWQRHSSWEAFREQQVGRLVLLTAHSQQSYLETGFEEEDILLLGRESAGVPQSVRDVADLSVTIPMRAGVRSLNVAIAGAMVLSEALRQTGKFPKV